MTAKTADGDHRFGFIERSVINRDGEPARCKAVIRLGMGTDGESCGHCNQPITRDVTLKEDGTLFHVEQGEITPKDFANKVLAQLNAFHGRMDAYVRKYGATLYRGPK